MTRRQKQTAAKRKRTIVADAGLVLVRSTERRVRLTVVMRQIRTTGTGAASTTLVVGPDIVASAHLDEDAIDQLIRRLQNVRGGKAARKPKRPPTSPSNDPIGLHSMIEGNRD